MSQIVAMGEIFFTISMNNEIGLINKTYNEVQS